ncbi:hypothetical protein LAZ67_8000407 [Cordylochernes scorpioides]|uniref:Gag-pol polyprotein n=1 Tax=Cordylochernes scorpioides TaxID=51811 RepID=A0ABY6KPG2_9ARAC|nr:hypothetical protein LAZ67_8000407 [Cordylochernes scorpioides]
MNKIPYRQTIGSLMYLMTGTRPDIAYAVSRVSQFMNNPGPSHWTAVKKIFGYLKATKNIGICFGGSSCTSTLIGFSDADFAADIFTKALPPERHKRLRSQLGLFETTECSSVFVFHNFPRDILVQMLGFHRRAKAKTSLEDDDVPIDDTTTKPLFTPQEKGRKEPVKVDRITEDSSMQRMTEVRFDYFADALTNMQPHYEDLVGRLTDAIRGLAVPHLSTDPTQQAAFFHTAISRDQLQPASAISSYSSQKRDGSWKFCVDYRKLNNVTVKDVYPFRRIDDVMDTLQGSSHDFTSHLMRVEAVLKCFCKSSLELNASVYGEECMSIQMVRRWRSWFLEGWQNVHDDERSGSPVTATDNAAVAAVRNVVEADRRVTIDEIIIRLPPGIEIRRSSIGTIMSDVLDFRKVCARWVARLLLENHKQQRMEAARVFLEMHQRDGDQLFSRIVTGDESWVHHSTPETKRQSMVWKKPEESAPKKAKVTISAGKVMAMENFKWEIFTHPPHSPELAPSDFHLYPALK